MTWLVSEVDVDNLHIEIDPVGISFIRDMDIALGVFGFRD
jgi:hypothetical protein